MDGVSINGGKDPDEHHQCVKVIQRAKEIPLSTILKLGMRIVYGCRVVEIILEVYDIHTCDFFEN